MPIHAHYFYLLLKTFKTLYTFNQYLYLYKHKLSFFFRYKHYIITGIVRIFTNNDNNFIRYSFFVYSFAKVNKLP
jgi:hypothetical protein